MAQRIADENLSAKNHPKIKEFVDLALQKELGELTFDDIQSREFLKFWEGFIITEYIDEKKDFQVRYWGSAVVRGLGKEGTGKILAELYSGEFEKKVRKLIKIVIDKFKIIYNFDRIYWENKDYKKRYRVALPLKNRDGRIFCLAFMVIEYDSIASTDAFNCSSVPSS